MQNEMQCPFDLSKAVRPETAYTEREYAYENGEQNLMFVRQCDADGNVIVSETYSRGEASMRSECRYIFLPDGKVAVKHVVSFVGDGQDGWNEMKREYVVYEYHENGLIAVKTYYDESGLRRPEREVYDCGDDADNCTEYDENGRIIRVQVNDENGYPVQLHTYEYGDAGQLLRRTIAFYPESEIDVYEDVYAYDGQNRLISEESYDNGELTNKRIREYPD